MIDNNLQDELISLIMNLVLLELVGKMRPELAGRRRLESPEVHGVASFWTVRFQSMHHSLEAD